jgi:hypothetical protein
MRPTSNISGYAQQCGTESGVGSDALVNLRTVCRLRSQLMGAELMSPDVRYQLYGHHSLEGHDEVSSSAQSPQWHACCPHSAHATVRSVHGCCGWGVIGTV